MKNVSLPKLYDIERIYDILMSNDVVESIEQNEAYLQEQIPEILPMIGFDQKHPHHHLDLWNHSLYALSMAEENFEVRLSLLLHDIGKPTSYQEENGIRHYRNHAKVSSEMAEKILSRLNFSEAFIKRISYLIENHDTRVTEEQIETDFETACILYRIQYCDAMAHNPQKLEKRREYLIDTEKRLRKKGFLK